MNSFPVVITSLFALGFRIFFILAGLGGLMLMVLWGARYAGGFSVGDYYGATAWHAHEMIFGYVVAVIAGFLLTAVRNWTSRDTATGVRLALLALVWLYARLAPFYEGVLPAPLIAAMDLIFLPWLMVEVALPVLRAGMARNLVFALLLLLMALGNLMVHGEILGVLEFGLWLGTKLAVSAVILMIIVIAGRIFPFFTERGVAGAEPRRRPLVDAISIASAVALFLAEGSGWPSGLVAVLALAAAAAHGVRLFGWYVPGIWQVPLLWVLYLGYGWLIVGFLLSALAAIGLVTGSLALHAFTAGAIGVLTLGMMARVSLGHTGRPLVAHGGIKAAFLLMNVAALVRVSAPLLTTFGYAVVIAVSAVLWALAFALFLYVYVPILTAPRADGRPG